MAEVVLDPWQTIVDVGWPSEGEPGSAFPTYVGVQLVTYSIPYLVQDGSTTWLASDYYTSSEAGLSTFLWYCKITNKILYYPGSGWQYLITSGDVTFENTWQFDNILEWFHTTPGGPYPFYNHIINISPFGEFTVGAHMKIVETASGTAPPLISSVPFVSPGHIELQNITGPDYYDEPNGTWTPMENVTVKFAGNSCTLEGHQISRGNPSYKFQNMDPPGDGTLEVWPGPWGTAGWEIYRI